MTADRLWHHSNMPRARTAKAPPLAYRQADASRSDFEVCDMWIVAIAWMYVALMMALAEATSTQGTVLGAIFTFLLYGLGPLALVMYLLGAPARRKAILRAEAEALARETLAREAAAAQVAAPDLSAGTQADGGGLTTASAVAPMREETPGR